MRHKIFSCACALACVSLWATAALASSTAAFESHRAFVGAVAARFVPASQDDKKDKDKDKSKDKDKDKEKSKSGGDANKNQSAPVKLSADEAKALKKIQDATDAATKLQAASDYVKKYPKSLKRPDVAGYLADQVQNTKDAAQKVTLGEKYLTIFNDPSEAALINPVLFDAYIDANRLDDAFRAGAVYLEKNPNSVQALTRLAIIGSNEASRNNLKYTAQSEQYGMKAIELIEADKKPEGMDAAAWQQYKTGRLPDLYRNMGLLALRANNAAEAKSRLEKAAALKSTDPFVYGVLGNMADDEYVALAKQYQSTHDAATLTRAQAQMDKVIALYAQAIGLAGEKPDYQQLREQVKPGLENYYKFRHNNSTAGLDELIAKYKTAAP